MTRIARLAPARCAGKTLANDLDLQEQAERNLLGQRAADLLRELPEAQRRCLVLAYLGGNTMTEITALTGVPTGTVKTRCRAALRKLRELTAQQDLTPDVSGGFILAGRVCPQPPHHEAMEHP